MSREERSTPKATAADSDRFKATPLWLQVADRFLDRLPNMKAMEVSGTLMALGKAGRLSDAAFRRIQFPLMHWWATFTSCNFLFDTAGLYLLHLSP